MEHYNQNCWHNQRSIPLCEEKDLTHFGVKNSVLNDDTSLFHTNCCKEMLGFSVNSTRLMNNEDLNARNSNELAYLT